MKKRGIKMPLGKPMKKILQALSFDGLELEASRHLANLKAIDPLKIFYHTIDYKVFNETHEIPLRIYFPNKKAWENREQSYKGYPVFLFIHGGGWATEHIDNYERICARLASATNHLVVAVEYRLAPEHKFPMGLLDCYTVAEALYRNQFLLNIDPDKITIIGDSAGGNLTAAISLMARDKGKFMPKRQILIYPAVGSDYSEDSPFESVRTNGSDYLLTAGKMREYINMYAKTEKDKINPYFAPIYEIDYANQPRTLILTAEFDPLRDEGEEYGKRLKEAGNEVVVHRIKDALHGYFVLGIKAYHVQESFDYINEFLQEV